MTSTPSVPGRFARAAVSHPLWVILLTAIITSIALRHTSRLAFEIDADSQLPQAHPYIQTLNRIHDEFGDKNLVIIGLFPRSGRIYERRFLQTVFAISQELSHLPGINQSLLQSIAAPSAKSIERGLGTLRVEPLMAAPPESADDLQRLEERISSDPHFLDTLVSSSVPAVAIYATFDLTPDLPGYTHIHHAIDAVLQRHADDSMDVRLSGPVIIASELNRQASQIAYFIPIALCLLALVHYDAFRTWQATVLPLATGAIAVLWSFGLLGLLGIPLDPFNSLTPILILSIAAGHAVQILQRFNEEIDAGGDSAETIIRTMDALGPVMVAAGCVASIAFLSLAAIGTRSMTTFGLLTATGVISVVALELTFIPALRSMLPPPPRQRHFRPILSSPLNAVVSLSEWAIISPLRAGLVTLAYSVVAIGCAYLSTKIDVDTSFMRAFSADAKIRSDDKALNRAFAGTNVLLLRVEGQNDGAITDPAVVKGIRQFTDELSRTPKVGKVLAVTDTIAQLHAALSPHGTDLPSTAELMTQYLFLYSLSGGNDLATKLTPDNRVTKIVVLIKSDSTRSGIRIIRDALELAKRTLPPSANVSVAGTLASNAALTEVIVKGKVQSILQIVALAGLCTAILFRSLLAGLLVATPLAASALVTFGLIGALGIPLDIPMAVASALALGMGADFGIYLLFRIREEAERSHSIEQGLSRAVHSSGAAIVSVATAIALGCGVLCLSSFRLFVQLGALAAMTMGVSTLVTVVVVPCLVQTCRGLRVTPRFLHFPTVCEDSAAAGARVAMK